MVISIDRGTRCVVLGMFFLVSLFIAFASVRAQDRVGPRQESDFRDLLPPPLTVTATPAKANFGLGEPVVIQCKVTNTSQSMVLAPNYETADARDSKYRMFKLVVKDRFGRETQPTRFYTEDVLGPGKGADTIHLEPGKSLEETLDVGVIRDMTSRGAYSVVVKFAYFTKGLGAKTPSVSSDSITVRVDSKEDLAVAQAALSITATTTKTEFRPLEPIVIHCKVLNTSGHNVSISEAMPLDGRDSKYLLYSIFAKGPYKQDAPPTRIVESIHSYFRTGSVSNLQPGRSLEDTLVANYVRDMTARGWYEVVVEVTYYNADGTHGVARSEPLTVHVSGVPDESQGPGDKAPEVPKPEGE